MSKIVVTGSYITDISVLVDRFGKPGETTIAKQVIYGPGGKGSNQATAAKRAGGDVVMIAKIGQDCMAKPAMEHYQQEGIDTTYLYTDRFHMTGVAMIEVNEKTAENRIIVTPNANNHLTAREVRKAEKKIAACNVVLVQLEASMESVTEAIHLAKKHNKKIILNPAPYRPIKDDLLQGIHFFTPNRNEAENFTGITVDGPRSAGKAAGILLSKGIKNVIITLGQQGALLKNDIWEILIPSVAVKAVDTTSAGDCFNGAFAVAIGEGMKISQAIKFANSAAALNVMKQGASVAMPMRHEIDDFYHRNYS